MAPPKRRRHDEDDNEIISVEHASSSLRTESHHKKPRLSVNGTTSKTQDSRRKSPSEDSSDASDNDEEMPDDEGEASAPAPTQWELLRDGNFAHVANPDRDDEIATQRFLARKQRLGDNRPSENSIIEEITCINFMCHEKLFVSLGPLINFVVGMNGSGKSAVLTAITLCLGGKATATNRGHSLKALIKQGQEHAILIIKLKNGGHDAYQPETYGESIIIERHFSKSGSSSFKLKTSTGRVMSTKKGDVDDIVEHFQLQVDNPMNILGQDAAKTFITASTPADKYRFFAKGVMLEALNNDYKIICDTCDTIETKLRESMGDLQALKDRADAAEKDRQISEQSQGIVIQRRRCRQQLAWVQAKEQEEALEQRQRTVAETHNEVQEAERRVEVDDQLFQFVERDLEQAKTSHDAVVQELAPFKAQEEKIINEVNEVKAELEAARRETRDIGGNVKQCRNQIAEYKKSIAEEERRIEDAHGGANARKREQIEAAREAVNQSKEALERNKEELPCLERTKNETLAEVAKAKEVLGAKARELTIATNVLQQHNQARGNKMAGFDPKMTQLLTAIQADKGFREPPIGPVGLHVRLLDSKWSPILESILGSALGGFVVANKPDQQRLSGIINRFGMGAFTSVSIVNRQPIDTSAYEPDPGFTTILRVLEFDNVLVRNSLIVTQAIDQVLLVDNREDAFKIMFQGPRLQNVKRCYTIPEGDPSRGIHMARVGNNGKDVSTIARAQARSSRMQTNIEEQITFHTQIVSNLERQKTELENNVRQLQQKCQRCESEVKKNKTQFRVLTVQIQRAEDEVEGLQSELEAQTLEDGKLEALRMSLEEVEKELAIAEESYGNQGLEMGKLNKASLDKKHELEAFRTQMEEHNTKIEKALQKVARQEQARRVQLLAKNTAVDNLEIARDATAKAERKRDAQAANVALHVAEATKVCERVEIDPGETVDTLSAKYKKLKEQIEQFNKRLGGDAEHINNKAERTKLAYEEQKLARRGLNDLLKLLKSTLLKRIIMYRRFQKSISARSRINFSYLLSERAFRGKLTIDHERRLLDVHVEPDETTKSGKGRKTKTLSGGEKSFSSICLLLSLWEAMSAPLRCLDEYDVFMDDVNRDVSTKMIISAARRSVGRQFILITPKALGAGATEAKDLDVKITKLFDPRIQRIDDMMEE